MFQLSEDDAELALDRAQGGLVRAVTGETQPTLQAPKRIRLRIGLSRWHGVPFRGLVSFHESASRAASGLRGTREGHVIKTPNK